MARLGNFLALVRVPSTRRVLDLQDPVDPVAHLVDAPDLAHGPDLARRGPVALAAPDPQAVLRQQARHHARSAHRRIAHAVADSSIQRRRKAQ